MAPLTITITYDNYGSVPGLKYGWGFSCLVRGAFGKVLFDTGSDGTSLLDNMRMVMGMGIRKVAPTHCTGKRAIRIFEDAYGDAFIPMGVGSVIES